MVCPLIFRPKTDSKFSKLKGFIVVIVKTEDTYVAAGQKTIYKYAFQTLSTSLLAQHKKFYCIFIN